MSDADARRAIEERFTTLWPTALPAITPVPPIFFEPDPDFDKPDAPYVALRWREQPPADLPGAGGSGRLDLGAGAGFAARRRLFGEIMVEIFVPERAGSHVAYQLVDRVRSIFQDASFQLGASGGIHCLTTGHQTRGVEEQRFVVVARTPYHRDVSG